MPEYKQMTLSECAKFDKDNHISSKLTGWGKICKLRANENSRAQKRKRNVAGRSKAKGY